MPVRTLPGHFYSPIPSREEVSEVVTRIRAEHTVSSERPGIRLNGEKQRDLLKIFETFYKDLPFPEEQSDRCRYYFRQSPYPYPDAIFLYSFLRHVKPKQIIEVGSGFSSAVILDTVDRFFPQPPRLTFIEPYPVTLTRLLRPEDARKVTIIKERVQTTPLELFESLNSGDLLFIDSSHIVKCGSDVSFLIFDVLPRLPVGVYVHFHDIFQSFEYPEEWLLQGWYLERGLLSASLAVKQPGLGDLFLQQLRAHGFRRLSRRKDASVSERCRRQPLYSKDRCRLNAHPLLPSILLARRKSEHTVFSARRFTPP